MAYLLPSLAAPTLRLPSRQRLVLLRNRAVTITCWAVALTLTAGRLVRIGFEWARPYLAKALHALAIALDGGLAFPDQPEPDPTPDPPIEYLEIVPSPEMLAAVRAASQPMAAGELIASSRPRARRRTTKAAPKTAA